MAPDDAFAPTRDLSAADIIEIEVVDSPSARRSRATRTAQVLPASTRPNHRSVQRPTRRQVVASTVALGLVAVALVVWQPWRPQQPEWRTYALATRFPPSLTARLVLDQPPGDIFQAFIPESPLATAVTRSTLVGHVFARPGSTMRSDPWLSFSALPSYSPAAVATGEFTVRDTDATIERTEQQVTVEWGPIDRRSWTAIGGGVDDATLLAFADSVGIVDEQPALRGSYDLDGMVALGGVEGLRTALTVERALDQFDPVAAVKPTVVRYADGAQPLTLLSLPAPPDTLPFVPFVFGNGGLVDEVTVRGLPAVALATATDDNLVAWLEGGRLVVVAGRQPLDDLLRWAATTRAATDGEWLEAGSAIEATVMIIATGVEVGAGVTPNGNSWRVVVSDVSLSGAFCLVTVNGEACALTTGFEQPPLDDWFVGEGRVTVRFSTPGAASVARVTTPDGTVTEFPFVAVDDTRTAAAVFVANGDVLELVAG